VGGKVRPSIQGKISRNFETEGLKKGGGKKEAVNGGQEKENNKVNARLVKIKKVSSGVGGGVKNG